MTTFHAHRRGVSRLMRATSMAAIMLMVSVGSAMAWVRPTLAADCAPDSNHYSWEISLTREPDYLIQFSWNANFTNAWTVNFDSAGSHAFDTTRGGSTLYARWKNDIAKSTSAGANRELCVQPTPTSTPTPTPMPTPTRTATPAATPTVTPLPSETPTATLSPPATPTPRESELPGNPTPPVAQLPDTAATIQVTPMLAVGILPLALLVISIAVAAVAFARRR